MRSRRTMSSAVSKRRSMSLPPASRASIGASTRHDPTMSPDWVSVTARISPCSPKRSSAGRNPVSRATATSRKRRARSSATTPRRTSASKGLAGSWRVAAGTDAIAPPGVVRRTVGARCDAPMTGIAGRCRESVKGEDLHSRMFIREVLALAVACACLQCHAASSCASTIAGLRSLLADESFALEWRETTMDDEKPLVLSVLERDGILFLVFVKTGEGLWAEGAALVCRDGEALEANLPSQNLKVGPAAGWRGRYAFANGAL